MPQKRVKRKAKTRKKAVRGGCPKKIRGGCPKTIHGAGFIGDTYKRVRKAAPYVLGIGAGLGAGYLLMNSPAAFANLANSRRQNWYSGQTGIKYKYIK